MDKKNFDFLMQRLDSVQTTASEIREELEGIEFEIDTIKMILKHEYEKGDAGPKPTSPPNTPEGT